MQPQNFLWAVRMSTSRRPLYHHGPRWSTWKLWTHIGARYWGRIFWPWWQLTRLSRGTGPEQQAQWADLQTKAWAKQFRLNHTPDKTISWIPLSPHKNRPNVADFLFVFFCSVCFRAPFIVTSYIYLRISLYLYYLVSPNCISSTLPSQRIEVYRTAVNKVKTCIDVFQLLNFANQTLWVNVASR